MDARKRWLMNELARPPPSRVRATYVPELPVREAIRPGIA